MLNNPIIPGFYPDPSICRVGGDFFLVNSSFEFFPGLPLWHSRDLVHWEQWGHVLTRDSQLPLTGCRPSGGLYAPCIRYHQGRFYVVCTNVSGGGNFCVYTDDPRAEWSEPVYFDQPGIDPDLFFDEDGQAYLTTTFAVDGRQGIRCAPVDLTSGKLLDAPRLLWSGSGGRYPEGPHLYAVNGCYYLMIAEGGTEAGHMETVARSRALFGPYEGCPYNPMMTNRNEYDNIVGGTGHADLVQTSDGAWWAVFLAYRVGESYFHFLGRETFLAPVVWRDGWPLINDGKPIRTEMDVICLPACPVPPEPVMTRFTNEPLALFWNYLRNPRRALYSGTRDGLILRGCQDTLDDAAAPTAIFRRQRQWDMDVQVVMQEPDVAEGARTGLTVFYQPKRHYDFYYTHRQGKLLLCIRRVVDDMECVTEYPPAWGSALGVRGTKDAYCFYLRSADGVVSDLLSVPTRHLSTEAAPLGFTGVYVGLFAQGDAVGVFRSFSCQFGS